MSSAHNIAKRLHDAPEYLDPGASGTITVDRSPCVVALVSAAAEARTLARPTRVGASVFLYMKTDGGDITLTVTGGYNEDGDTTFTFDDPGEFFHAISAYDGTNYYWRLISDHTKGVITQTEAGYLEDVTAGTVAASKAVVLDSSSAVAGTWFPTTTPTKTVASAASANLKAIAVADATMTLTGTTQVTAAQGAVNIGTITLTDASAVTVDTYAALYIAAAPTTGGSVTLTSAYAIWVDGGNCRFDGDIVLTAGAMDFDIASNTAAAVEFDDGTTKVLAIDTRNTVKDANTVTITGEPCTIASEGAAHVNASLRIAAKTITYTGTTGTTSSLGVMLSIAAPTFTDASMMTLSTASSVHITAVAAAGGMLTITNSRMISTSVSDCFLTNAGVWTDTACWESGKQMVSRVASKAKDAVAKVLDKIIPATWKYKPETELPGIDDKGNPIVHRTPINDRDRERVGIVYDDLPEELRAPGEENAVSTGILSSFALAAIKFLFEENRELKARLEALGG